MITKFSGKFAIIMLKKHRRFCRCGLTHLDDTPTFKNRPNTYGPPCKLPHKAELQQEGICFLIHLFARDV